MQRFTLLPVLLLTLSAAALAWLSAAPHTNLTNARAEPEQRTSEAELARTFKQTIRPFLAAHCTSCHSGAMAAASFDVSRYTTLDVVVPEAVVADFARWTLVARKLAARAMPPKEMQQPAESARQQVIEWIAAVRRNQREFDVRIRSQRPEAPSRHVN